MSNFVEQQNSNKHIYKRVLDKLLKIHNHILNDVESLKEVARSLPAVLSHEEHEKLSKAIQNLDLRIKLQNQKLDKIDSQIADFKILNSKFINAYENLGSQSSINAVLNETAAYYVELENAFNKAKEMLADLLEISEEFKKKYNLETEKGKMKKVIKEVVSEDIQSIAEALKSVFPSEDFLTIKLKESMSCVNGKCTILESDLKRVQSKLENELHNMRFKLDEVINTIDMIANEQRTKAINAANEMDATKNEIMRVRLELMQRLRNFEQGFNNTLVKY